jgi:hypothetical protein
MLDCTSVSLSNAQISRQPNTSPCPLRTKQTRKILEIKLKRTEFWTPVSREEDEYRYEFSLSPTVDPSSITSMFTRRQIDIKRRLKIYDLFVSFK